MPRSATTPVSTLPKLTVSPASSPAEGSSKRNRSKGPARTRASSTRRRCPVGSSPAWRSERGPMPVSSMASSTARRTTARSRTAPDQLGEGVGPGHERLAAQLHVLAHAERVEQLGLLEGAPEPEARPPGRADPRHLALVQGEPPPSA